MFRKLIAIGLTSMLCFSFASCKDKNSKSTNEESGAQFIKTGYIEYNNGCVFGENPTRYLDYSSLESSPLCAVPNCTHKSGDCLAMQIGNTPVFYNNHVYFFESNYGNVRETPDGSEFYIDSSLKKASLDSSEIETVCEFHDAAPFDGEIGMVLNGCELYFVADDLNLEGDPYGGYSWGNSGGNHYLCCINLDTGDYKNYGSLYDGDKEFEGADFSSSANIIGVRDNKVLINYTFIKDNDALQNSDGTVNDDSIWTRISIEFDLEKKTLAELEMPFSLYANDDIYTHYNYDTGTLEVNYEGEDKQIVCDNPYFALKEINGKLFFTDQGTFYDLNTMTKYNLGEYANYNVMGYSDGGYIFGTVRKAVKLSEDELLALNKG